MGPALGPTCVRSYLVLWRDKRTLRYLLALRHPADEAAAVFAVEQDKAHSHMAAPRPRAGEVLRHLVQLHVPVHHLEQQLGRTLQPHVCTAQAGRLDD
jgi:hypothetical protein